MVNSNYFYVDCRQVKSLRISWPPPPIPSFLSFLLQPLVLHVHRVQTDTHFGPSFLKITLKNDFVGSIQNLHYIVSLLACLIICRNFLYSFFFSPICIPMSVSVLCKGNPFFQAFQLGVRQSGDSEEPASTCHWGASSVSRHGRCRRGGREAHKTELSKAASRLVSRW